MMANIKNTLSIEVINAETASKYIYRGTGCILLGSHLGSFDLLRFLAEQQNGLKLKIVMDKEPSQYINQRLYGGDSAIQADFINASDHDCIFKIEQALKEGGIIGMLGDRVVNQQRTVSCSFLGDQAEFPSGPMLLASIANVPVILFFGIYLGGNRYKIIFELLEESFLVSRRERQLKVDEYVKKYAQRLEHYTECYPYNWFNFYEYWKNGQY
jgi:predicted LPLAT superfamily acyltransferase